MIAKMGNTCDCQSPTTTNMCESDLGDKESDVVENFCTIGGFLGDKARQEICSEVGDEEWDYANDPLRPDVFQSCLLSSCNSTSKCNGICASDGCFSILGTGVKCRRKKYSGDPAPCCLQDYVCNQQTSACFSDQGQKKTCANGNKGAPNHRDPTSPDCQTAIFDYCSGGDGVSANEWFARWTNGRCLQGLERNLFNDYQSVGIATCLSPPPRTPGSPCNAETFGIKTAGFFWAQSLIHQVLKRYQEEGFVLGTSPGQKGYNPFQDYLYSNICCPYPGLCQNGLGAACSSLTMAELSSNFNAANWCGCHLNPSEYQKYADVYGINPSCSPSCNRSSSLPLITTNQQPLTCNENICILDDVTVNLVSSVGNGNVTFAQICGGCPPGACSCTIEQASATLIDDTLKNTNIDYINACGSLTSLQDNRSNYGPSTIATASGSSISPASTIEKKQASFNARKNGMIFVWFIIFFVLIAVLILIFCR